MKIRTTSSSTKTHQVNQVASTASQTARSLAASHTVREAIEAPPTSLETAAVQACQQQRRAQLKMAVMDRLYTQATAGNASAQIRFLAGSRRCQRNTGSNHSRSRPKATSKQCAQVRRGMAGLPAEHPHFMLSPTE